MRIYVHLLDFNIFGITEFFHCSQPIREYSYVTLSFTSCIDILHIVVCFLICNVGLRVTMTSPTQGGITGYLPRARLRLSHMEKGMHYVQICDKY